MIEVELPDGTIAEFPDGTPNDVIKGALQKRFAPQAAPEQPGAVADSFSSFASGVGRGAADLVGLPGTIGDILRGGGQWAMRKGYELGTGEAPSQDGGMVERFFAGNPDLEAQMVGGGSSPLGGQNLRAGLSTVTGGATDYQPSTTAGEYARTVGEFLPGAMALGGGGVANALRYGVVPAVTSETAGQATEGTAVEPYARIAGALLGGAVGSRVGRPAAQKPPSAAEIKKSAGYGDAMTDTLRQARTTDSNAVSTRSSKCRIDRASERERWKPSTGRTARGWGHHQPRRPRRPTGIGKSPAR